MGSGGAGGLAAWGSDVVERTARHVTAALQMAGAVRSPSDLVRTAVSSPQGAGVARYVLNKLPWLDENDKAMVTRHLNEAWLGKRRARTAGKVGKTAQGPPNTTDQSSLAVDQFLGQLFGADNVGNVEKAIGEMSAQKEVNPQLAMQYATKFLPYDSDNTNKQVADIASKVNLSDKNWDNLSNREKQEVSERVRAIQQGAQMADRLRRRASWEKVSQAFKNLSARATNDAKLATAKVYTTLAPVLSNIGTGLEAVGKIQNTEQNLLAMYNESFAGRADDAPQMASTGMRRLMQSPGGRKYVATRLVRTALKRAGTKSKLIDQFKNSAATWTRGKTDNNKPFHKALSFTNECLNRAAENMKTKAGKASKILDDDYLNNDEYGFFNDVPDLDPEPRFKADEKGPLNTAVARIRLGGTLQALLGTAGRTMTQAEATTLLKGRGKKKKSEGEDEDQYDAWMVSKGGMGSGVSDERKTELRDTSRGLMWGFNWISKYIKQYKTKGGLDMFMHEYIDQGNPLMAGRGQDGFELDRSIFEQDHVRVYRPEFSGADDEVFGLTDKDGNNMVVQLWKQSTAVKEADGSIRAKEIKELHKTVREAQGFGNAHLTALSMQALRSVGETAKKYIQSGIKAERSYRILSAMGEERSQNPAYKAVQDELDRYSEGTKASARQIYGDRLWILDNMEYKPHLDRLVPPKAERIAGELYSRGTKKSVEGLVSEFSQADVDINLSTTQARNAVTALHGLYRHAGIDGMETAHKLGSNLLDTVIQQSSENKRPRPLKDPNMIIGGGLTRTPGDIQLNLLISPTRNVLNDAPVGEKSFQIPGAENKRSVARMGFQIPSSSREEYRSMARYIKNHSPKGLGSTKADRRLQDLKTTLLRAFTRRERFRNQGPVSQTLEALPFVTNDLNGEDVILMPEYDKNQETIWLAMYVPDKIANKRRQEAR